MSRRELEKAALEAEIARLPDLGHDELRKRWKLLFGHAAPTSLRRKFMARAVAYQMQVVAYGGLSAATKRRLREIASAISSGDRTGVISGVQIRPGTQLIRQWQNTTHTVMVLNEGFALDGRTYKSLSAIAKAITGTNWNGYAFFGIKRAARGNKAAAGLKRDLRLMSQPDSKGDARGPSRNRNERDSRA
jgi:Protein of unknown function (DUF2924)